MTAKADTNPREALEQAHEILRGPHYQGGASLMAIGQAFGVLDAALASEPVAGTLYQVSKCDDGQWMVHTEGDVIAYPGQGNEEEKAKALCAALNRSAPPAPAGRERTDEEIDERLAKQEARDNLRLLDFIADKIGLPHNEELSRGNFLAWQSSLPPQGDRATASDPEPVAWKYKCQDGSEVLMLKRLTDEQKRRGYYTGEDGEDEVDGDEAIVGPFHWAEETPLYPTPPVPGAADRATVVGECASVVGKMRQSEAGLFDAKHSGQRGRDRADALYDAYIAIRSLATDLRIEAAFSRAQRGTE